MKYLLEWNYLGYNSETFNSSNITDNLYDDLKEYWKQTRPFEGLLLYVYDEGGNLVFKLT